MASNTHIHLCNYAVMSYEILKLVFLSMLSLSQLISQSVCQAVFICCLLATDFLDNY